MKYAMLLIAMVLVIAGCSSSDDTPVTPPTPTEPAAQDQEVSLDTLFVAQLAILKNANKLVNERAKELELALARADQVDAELQRLRGKALRVRRAIEDEAPKAQAQVAAK